MDREELLKKVQLVSPALGRGDLLPQLAHLWFDGEHLLAFDDNIAIETACDFDYNGSLEGETLRQALERSQSHKARITTDKGGARYRSGKYHIGLNAFAPDERPFDFPKAKGSPLDFDAAAYKPILAWSLETLGTDVTYPEWCGLTLQSDKKALKQFTGYQSALSRAIVPLRGKTSFDRVVLHPRFCEQMLKHLPDKNSKRHSAELYITEEYSLFIAPEVKIFGRTLIADTRLDLDDMSNHIIGKKHKFVKIPKKLGNMLQRSEILIDEHNNLTFTVQDSDKGLELCMITKRGDNESVDRAALDGEHPEIEVNTNARHLRAAVALEEFAVSEEEIIFREGDRRHLIVSVK